MRGLPYGWDYSDLKLDFISTMTGTGIWRKIVGWNGTNDKNCQNIEIVLCKISELR